MIDFVLKILIRFTKMLLLSFVSILFVTRLKCVSEDSKKMKKKFR